MLTLWGGLAYGWGRLALRSGAFELTFRAALMLTFWVGAYAAQNCGSFCLGNNMLRIGAQIEPAQRLTFGVIDGGLTV